jgi:hypothetical protein
MAAVKENARLRIRAKIRAKAMPNIKYIEVYTITLIPGSYAHGPNG